jgi:SET and MYND domain-containing protein
MQLAITKHFLCRCQRCSEPFASSIDRFLEGCICTVRGCDGVIVKASSLHEVESTESLLSSWECDQCSRIFYPNMLGCATQPGAVRDYPGLLVAKAEKKLAEAMNVYKERRFKDARVLLENYIDEFTGRLHPLNVLLFDALTPLMSCCRALGDAAEGSRVCQNILSCMEKVLSRFSLELANFYFCLGEMYLERSEGPGSNVITKHHRKLAHESFQRVRMIRKICLGKDTLPGEIPKDRGLAWHK